MISTELLYDKSLLQKILFLLEIFVKIDLENAITKKFEQR